MIIQPPDTKLCEWEMLEEAVEVSEDIGGEAGRDVEVNRMPFTETSQSSDHLLASNTTKSPLTSVVHKAPLKSVEADDLSSANGIAESNVSGVEPKRLDIAPTTDLPPATLESTSTRAITSVPISDDGDDSWLDW